MKRIAIVGASSGLGRCLGRGLSERGARVALLARRREMLEAAAEEAGEGTVVAPCDVTDEDSVRTAIDKVVGDMGGLDGIVYCSVTGILQRLEDLGVDEWHRAFATNVIGASQVTRFALPHLRESSGVAVYLSSSSASLTAPWPGLGAYIVSKAALDKLVDAWRAEHPKIGFTRVIVGECAGGEGDSMTQLTADWDPELAGEMVTTWNERGLIDYNLMDVQHLVEAVDAVLQTGATASIPLLAVTPRRPL